MYCILTIVRYPKWFGWAGFFSMTFFRLPLFLNRKITFWKLLGSGKNGTFDKRPDWRQWAILVSLPKLTVDSWQLSKEKNSDKIISHLSSFVSKYFQFFRCETCTLILEPTEGHGKWDGKNCFGELPKKSEHEGMICVLTRATIRLNKLNSFWKNVESVSSQMQDAQGFITSAGIGEIPFIKQATFSIWQSKKHMKQFAYSMKEHAEVIKKTRKENWYSEEMFVRFKLIDSFGSLNGKKYF
jgi:hypothetical protein